MVFSTVFFTGLVQDGYYCTSYHRVRYVQNSKGRNEHKSGRGKKYVKIGKQSIKCRDVIPSVQNGKGAPLIHSISCEMPRF